MKTKAILTFLAFLVLGACAQQLGDIDRTQDNIVDKTMLKGEWYFRQTVVKAPYASGYTFIGDQSKLERGVFEIQEKTLFFYRTYEFTYGIEQPGLKSDVDTPYKNANNDFVGNKILGKDGADFTCENDHTKCVDGNGNAVECPKRCVDSTCKVYRMADMKCKQTTGEMMAVCGKTEGNEDSAESYCVVPRFIYRGAPLAAWPITSHFDIIYDYNTATGEKSNVKVENTTDNLWFDRKYMRVDWSASQIDNYEFSLTNFSGNGVFFTTYPGDADNPDDKPVFENNYMDFTTELTVTAPQTYYVYWDSYVPLCWFYPWYTGGIYECTSENFKIRTAFEKVPKTTYKAWNYDDKNMEKFGFFRSERLYYDKYYGISYSGATRNIGRHDIWKEWKFKADGTPDYANMEPKPIVYYLSKDFPRDLVAQAKDLAKQWSEPFADIVKYYKGAAPAHQMFVLCENSNADVDVANQWFDDNKDTLPANAVAADYIAETDSTYCLNMDKPKRNGDLRYSYLFSVNPPTMVGLYGFGPPSLDPLTGEIIVGNAYIYTPALYQGANRAVDIIEAMAGVKEWNDITSADYINQDMKIKGLKINGMYNFNISDQDAPSVASQMIPQKVRTQIKATGLNLSDQNFARGRMKILHDFGSNIEKMFISPEVRVLFKDYANMKDRPLTKEQIDKDALYQWANNSGWHKKLDYYTSMSKKTLYLAEFMDNALAGMAKEYADKYNQEICSDIDTRLQNGEDLVYDMNEFTKLLGPCDASKKDQYDDSGNKCVKVSQGTGVTGSYFWRNDCTVKKLRIQLINYYMDKENLNKYDYDIYKRHYLPVALYMNSKYPEISRSQNVLLDKIDEMHDRFLKEIWQNMWESTALHEIGHTLGLRHNFRGSADPMNYPKEFWSLKVKKDNGTFTSKNLWSAETRNQYLNKMREYQYSSVMDYGSKVNSDWHGLGLYDKSAVLYGYGRLVQVFNKKPDISKYEKYLKDPTEGEPNYLQGTLKPSRDKLIRLFDTVHYTQMPNVFGSIDAMYDRKLKRVDELSDNDVEVPYRFCSDEMVGWKPMCNVWDEGADEFEVTWNALKDVEEYWIFWGTWHQNPLFWPEQYYYRVLRQYKIAQQTYQYWVVNYEKFNHNDFWKNNFGKRWEEDINGGLSGAMATLWSFNYFGYQFGRPSPGTYGFRNSVDPDGNESFVVEPIIWGKQSEFNPLFRIYSDMHAIPMYNSWNSGGNDMYPVSAGSFYNRLAAFEVLTDPSTDFMATNGMEDTQRFLISYATMFPDEMFKLLGGLTVGKIKSYGWIVVDKDKAADFKGLNTFESDTYADAIGAYLVPRWIKPIKGFFENPEGTPLNPEQPDEYYFPTTKYRIPMLAAYYGLSLMPQNYDRSFIDATRVWLKGEGAQITIPEGKEKIEFTNPLSGRVYVSYNPNDDGKLDETAIGYYLLRMAKVLFKDYQGAEGLAELQKTFDGSTLEFIIGKLEILRGMNNAYEYHP